MHSLAIYPVDTIHALLAEHAGEKRMVLPTGEEVNITSQRLELFTTVGVSCSSCGLVGTYYSLDLPKEGVRPHLNLYALEPGRKRPVLMTKDHTYPKSMGGRDELSNYTPMCYWCNQAKAAKLPEEHAPKELATV